MCELSGQFLPGRNFCELAPLYAKSVELLSAIKAADVVSVKCSTGSGKSTVLPPLLLAMGFSRVAITQPRRLPCQNVQRHVSNTFGKRVAGWQVAGKGYQENKPLLFLTDGKPSEADAVVGHRLDLAS